MHYKIKDYLEVSTDHDTLYLAPEGFWSPQIFEKHHKGFKDSVLEAMDSFSGKPFILYVDLRKFRQPIDEMKALIGYLMEYGTKKGRYKSIEIVDKHLLKRSIENTAEGNMDNNDRIVVGSVEDADKAQADARKQMSKSS